MKLPVYLTEALARSAGNDKANRRMRKAGRTAWNQDDWACACSEYYRLMEAAGRPNPPIPHCVNSTLVP